MSKKMMNINKIINIKINKNDFEDLIVLLVENLRIVKTKLNEKKYLNEEDKFFYENQLRKINVLIGKLQTCELYNED